MGGIITAERIAELIEDAPAWALVGLTAPREGLRADARLELAQHVYSALFPVNVEAAQMALPW
ncbi:DUF6771 family protein [Sphingomonas sp. NFX23]|uniref:DUF6771 family protein n=1 Tax=Sphingomonas sp. NFX23 TaxID=2819532 RepID=UPI003CE7214B